MALANVDDRYAERRSLAPWAVALAGVLCAVAVAYVTYPRLIPLAAAAWLGMLILCLLRFGVLRPQRLVTLSAATIPLGVRIPLTESTSFDSVLMVLQLAFLIALSQTMLIGNRQRKVIALDLAIVWLMLAAIAATVGAVDVGLAVRKLYYLLNWGMIYFVVKWTVTDYERLRWTCRGLVFGAFVLALIGITQFVVSLLTSRMLVAMAMFVILPIFEGAVIEAGAREAFTPMFLNWMAPFGLLRVMGTHVAPMSYAQGISQFAFLPLVALYQWGAARWRRVWSVICIGIMVIGIILSFSRGAWLTLACGVCLYLILNKEATFVTKAKIVAWLIAGCAAIVMIVWVTLPDLSEGLSRFVVSAVAAPSKEDGWSQSNDVRIKTQVQAIDLLKENPILGVGPGNYGPALGLSTFDSAHNFYLQAAAEMGLAGLIGYVAVVVLALQGAYRAARRAVRAEVRAYGFAIFIGFLTVCIHSAFESYNYTPKVAIGWWMMVGLCGALSRFVERE